jgi:hypothetical protein
MAQSLNQQAVSVGKVFANVKLQLFLDKLDWVNTSSKLAGCINCRPERISTGQEDIAPPYLSSVSYKLFNKTFLARAAAKIILSHA